MSTFRDLGIPTPDVGRPENDAVEENGEQHPEGRDHSRRPIRSMYGYESYDPDDGSGEEW